jgi:hypothetical protein
MSDSEYNDESLSAVWLIDSSRREIHDPSSPTHPALSMGPQELVNAVHDMQRILRNSYPDREAGHGGAEH